VSRRSGVLPEARRHARAVAGIACVASGALTTAVAARPALGAPFAAFGARGSRISVASDDSRGGRGRGRRGRGQVWRRGKCARGHGRGDGGCALPGAGFLGLLARQRRPQGKLAEAGGGIFDPIHRLPVRVTVQPQPPALLLGIRRRGCLVERVAVLESDVPLVHRLKARPASSRAEAEGQRQAPIARLVHVQDR
jgi:hypothetical protein